MDPKQKEKIRRLANEILACIDDEGEGAEEEASEDNSPEGEDDDVGGKSLKMKLSKYT
jgi:hypothetical protein